MSKSVSIKLTKEQRQALKEASGKDIGEVELSVSELEDRIAPARFIRHLE